MDKNDLNSFREEWKHEIKTKQQGVVESFQHNLECPKDSSLLTTHSTLNSTVRIFESSEDEGSLSTSESSDHENVHTATKKPKLGPIALLTLEIPTYQQPGSTDGILTETGDKPHTSLQHPHGNEDLISLLIRDIDETTSIPFFDISLPKEVCVKIFSRLGVVDLGRCACVSKAWASIASDELIWYKVHKRLGFKDQGKNVKECAGWKSLVKDGILNQRLVTQNWKERICQIQTIEYEKGGILTACQLHGDQLIAGYANGKTCLWNLENNWRHFLDASEEVYQDPSQASVECVAVVDNVCVAAFSCGIVSVWHTDITVNPIYKYHVNKPANHVALASKKNPLLLGVSGTNIRVDHVSDDGQWQFLHGHMFDDQVSFVETLPNASETLFAVSLKEDVFLYEARRNVLKEVDKITGTKITSLACSEHFIAVGWAQFGFGMGTDFTAKVRLYDTANLRHLGSFLGHYADITCLNLSFAGGLVTGSKDKRVRVYDLRTEGPQLSLRGHSSSVTTVQMDSWKLVSGAFDGRLKVWDLRMGGELWETRASHPVKLSRFDEERLVTANVPVDKIPRGSMWYADDLIQHRRHRGTVQVYDFGSEAGAVVAPEEMRSNYDDISGYNYNINLVAPYDILTSEIN